MKDEDDINKSNKLKECMICHYSFFKEIFYMFEPHVCDKCHDISMMAYQLRNIAILNVKGVDYRCLLCNITRNVTINRFKNSKLHEKSTLWIWILVQIKRLLE